MSKKEQRKMNKFKKMVALNELLADKSDLTSAATAADGETAAKKAKLSLDQ